MQPRPFPSCRKNAVYLTMASAKIRLSEEWREQVTIRTWVKKMRLKVRVTDVNKSTVKSVTSTRVAAVNWSARRLSPTPGRSSLPNLRVVSMDHILRCNLEIDRSGALNNHSSLPQRGYFFTAQDFLSYSGLS
jgi:hypothetical protein